MKILKKLFYWYTCIPRNYLSYLQNYRKFEGEISDLQLDKYEHILGLLSH